MVEKANYSYLKISFRTVDIFLFTFVSTALATYRNYIGFCHPAFEKRSDYTHCFEGIKFKPKSDGRI